MMKTNLRQRIEANHQDHPVMLVLKQFKDGTEHWELRCRQCDKHIQYVTFTEANIIQQAIDEKQ